MSNCLYPLIYYYCYLHYICMPYALVLLKFYLNILTKLQFKMKFLQTLTIVCLFTFSHACLIFAGVFNRNARTLEGTLTDNGKRTCTFSGEASTQNKFASCIPGFSAYIHPSMFWGSYSNNGREGRFNIARDRVMKDGELTLTSRSFGCQVRLF